MAGGAELSFGQWQKLALARGFMRDRPLLLVLDEPTAALDAETEHALFERYASASRGGGGGGRDGGHGGRDGSDGEANDGRITLLVSHRFSTVRMADLILVMDGARLIEIRRARRVDGQGRSIRAAAWHPGRGVSLKPGASPRDTA